MTLRVGVAIGPASGAILAVHRNGAESKILFHHEVARPEGRKSWEILEELLSALPRDLGKAPVSLALSSGEFACADAWAPPEGLKRSALETLAPALCEARCAGETLEDLSLDVVLGEKSIHAVALSNEVLEGLRRVAAARGIPIHLVTAIPPVLAGVFSGKDELHVLSGGEGIEVRREGGVVSWRSYPLDPPECVSPNGALQWGGIVIPADRIPAFAAAVAEPDGLPNALRGAPDAPRSFLSRYLRPLLGLGAAVALFLGTLAFSFHRRTDSLRAEVEGLSRDEEGFQRTHLPGRSSKGPDLLRAMNDRLREAGESPSGSEFPSALSFWIEIARQMPDVEAMGMALESLDLSPEGGRLSAAVIPVAGDELRNAALLEGSLNKSPRMTARGDYERREKDLQVRLRIEFRPDRDPGGSR